VPKVLIEEQNPVLRMGLEALLGAVPGLDVLRGTGEPDVVVLGAAEPPLAEIAQRAGGARVVVLTSADDPRVLARTIEAGAHSCLVHGHFELADLVTVVLDAARGASHLSPPVVTALVQHLHGAQARRAGLTQREVEIMELVAAGLGNRAIATRLFISEKTVKNHIHSIYRRLRADGRAHAIARWRELS
jgi:DNA-binding NarL/FixJ family response regulator